MHGGITRYRMQTEKILKPQRTSVISIRSVTAVTITIPKRACTVGGSLFEGRVYVNGTDYLGATVGSATLSILEFSFKKNFKLNLVEAQATALTVGVYSQYVDAEVLLGSIGGVLKFENGALTIGFSLGWGIKITIRFW